MTIQRESLGPAETIIQTLLAYQDHLVHNRPGIVTPAPGTPVGVRWQMATTKKGEDGLVQVIALSRPSKKTVETPMGVLDADGKTVRQGARTTCEFRQAGLFPEAAIWMYRQVAEVWRMDNEFAARWASYQWPREHRDLKTVLAAFMLVQSRKGDPVREDGKVIFHDDDFRDVGEAMLLQFRKDDKEKWPKLLLRIHAVLSLPEIAKINRDLGFGQTDRRPPLGRWPKAVEKWLRFREENPAVLKGLVDAGYSGTVVDLCSRVRYKPGSEAFARILRWKQRQADGGHRTVAIGVEHAKQETWEGLTEEQVCERIVREKPAYKRLVTLLPRSVGQTRAVMAAAIEAGSLSDKDIVLLTPTLENLGLLQVPDVKARWEAAAKAQEDTRAANVALRVRSLEAREKLQGSADAAVAKAVEEVTRGVRTYFIVDISGSMQGAIEAAKRYVAQFLGGFPLDRVHVATFNTVARELVIRHPSRAGVDNAFQNVKAGGGTDYGAGVTELKKYAPSDDEDSLFIFFGDEEGADFDAEVRRSGLRPTAFGLVRVVGPQSHGTGMCVQSTARKLGIPCFQISEQTFSDVYAIPRTIRGLVASTPVGKTAVRTAAPRLTLVDEILKTPLLAKPAWAS